MKPVKAADVIKSLKTEPDNWRLSAVAQSSIFYIDGSWLDKDGKRFVRFGDFDEDSTAHIFGLIGSWRIRRALDQWMQLQ